jgi:hypothetical protein
VELCRGKRGARDMMTSSWDKVLLILLMLLLLLAMNSLNEADFLNRGTAFWASSQMLLLELFLSDRRGMSEMDLRSKGVVMGAATPAGSKGKETAGVAGVRKERTGLKEASCGGVEILGTAVTAAAGVGGGETREAEAESWSSSGPGARLAG